MQLKSKEAADDQRPQKPLATVAVDAKKGCAYRQDVCVSFFPCDNKDKQFFCAAY